MAVAADLKPAGRSFQKHARLSGRSSSSHRSAVGNRRSTVGDTRRYVVERRYNRCRYPSVRWVRSFYEKVHLNIFIKRLHSLAAG